MPASPQPSEPGYPRRPGIWWAIAAILCAASLAQWLNAPPAALPKTAPEQKFSAARAADTLADVLGPKQQPHPTGSRANAAVRDRLMGKLVAIGLMPELQRTISCAAAAPRCAYIENIIAELPGTGSDAIVVMAHYDSVPPSPGAGDNGAGVAAVLESLRAIQSAAAPAAASGDAPVAGGSSPAPTNSIIALFSDGEELGLLGAEAFFAEHPLRARVHAVVNLEGAGSGGGPVTLLRSTNRAGQLLDAYKTAARHPAALSLAQEVFSRMPNDTDFSVAARAGVPSIDFAFASEFSHYHTALDTLENLSLDTLQHHGDNLLPLLQQLQRSDLRIREPGYVYQNLASLWLTWPTPLSLWLALFAVVLLLGSAWRAQLSVKAIAAGSALAAAALVLPLLLCAAATSIVHNSLGVTPVFPANWQPWALLFSAAAAFPGVLLAQLLKHPFMPTHVGLWLVVAGLAVALAGIAPLAANLFIIPALVVAVATSICVFATPLLARLPRLTAAPPETVLLLLASSVMGYLFVGLAPIMAESQGLTLAPAIYAMLALGSWPLVLARGSASASAVVAVAALGGLIWVVNSPPYSPERPQSVSIHYVQNIDTKEASWLAYSDNPLPQTLASTVDYAQTARQRFPWETTPTLLPRATAPWVEISGGQLTSQRKELGVEFTYQPDPSVEHVSFIIPAVLLQSDSPSSGGTLSVNGYPVRGISQRGQGHVLFRFYAPPKAGISVLFTPATTAVTHATGLASTLYLMEGRSGLPPSAQRQSAVRAPLATPQHQGDQWLTFRRIVTP